MRTTLIMDRAQQADPDLTDIAANRVWPLDGVTGVTASIMVIGDLNQGLTPAEYNTNAAKSDLPERGFADGKEKFWNWLWRTQS